MIQLETLASVKRERLIRLGCLSVLFALTMLLLLRGLGNSSYGYPDADRILMDGVFISDFLREMPVTRIFDFTSTYYAKYPALSIGYRPPFFPFIEAIFNLIFGINIWSSRLALVAFALVGIWAYFRLVQSLTNMPTAFFSACLLITTPFVAGWGWYTMLEIPTLSMCLLAAYVFYLFITTSHKRYLYYSAVLVPLAAWTKQPAIFIVFWFFLYVVLTMKLRQLLRQRSTWIAVLLGVVLIVPLIAITLWLDDLNLAQSVGVTARKMNPPPPLNYWRGLGQYIYFLYHHQLTPPVLLLSLVGMGLAIAKRCRASLYPACLIIAAYLFFTLLRGPKMPRYTIYWIPAFTYFAALPLYYLGYLRRWKIALCAAFLTLTFYQIHATYAEEPSYATGYDQAAQVALTNLKGPTVLIDAYNNGYFTYFLRSLDPDRNTVVLRGDKLFSSSAVSARLWVTIHARTEQDIRNILDRYGVTIVVVEALDYTRIRIHRFFRSYLQGRDFELIKEIPIQTNRSQLMNNSLRVYRYLKAKPPSAEFITLELPIVGKTLKIPMNKLTDGKKEPH